MLYLNLSKNPIKINDPPLFLLFSPAHDIYQKTDVSTSKVGRPNETSAVTFRRRRLNYENAMFEITIRYQSKKDKVPNNSRLSKGCFQEIVNNMRREFQVEEKTSLSTVRNRLKRNA